LSGTASAAEVPSAVPQAAVSVSSYPSVCIFGKAHKHGKGCRGGSLVKPERATKCGKGAVVGGLAGAGFGGSFGPEFAPTGTYLGAAAGCVWKNVS
jgi:hypothetical protein